MGTMYAMTRFNGVGCTEVIGEAPAWCGRDRRGGEGATVDAEAGEQLGKRGKSSVVARRLLGTALKVG